MRAAVLAGRESMEVREVEDPKLEKGDILIRVRACGICASDLKTYHQGGSHYFKPPVILGHEYVGEVAEVTSNKQEKIKVGDLVSVIPALSCGRCLYCVRGLFSLCKKKLRPPNGGFAEYVKIPEEMGTDCLEKLPPNADLLTATFAEPLACCINAIESCNIGLGDKVLVIGAGVMGVLLLQLCNLRGASRAFITEIDRTRSKLVEEILGIKTLDPREEALLELADKVTDIGGFDCIITTVPDPEVIRSAEKLVREGGTIHFFAGSPKEIPSGISYNPIHYRQIEVVGTSTYSPLHFRQAIELIKAGRLNLTEMITHTKPLEEIEEAFRIANRSSSLKVVIEG